MIVAVPKEIKTHEYRVGLTPAGARALVEDGHRVLVQTGAGTGAGIEDADYRTAGAELTADAAELYAAAEMIVKVKEPLPAEYPLLRPKQLLFTYLHLAPDPKLTQALLEREVTGIAYETVELADGFLPLLHPMSEVAGRMSVQIGAHLLQREQGARDNCSAAFPAYGRPGWLFSAPAPSAATPCASPSVWAPMCASSISTAGASLPSTTITATVFRP